MKKNPKRGCERIFRCIAVFIYTDAVPALPHASVSICATVNDRVISRAPICDRTARYLSNEERRASDATRGVKDHIVYREMSFPINVKHKR